MMEDKRRRGRPHSRWLQDITNWMSTPTIDSGRTAKVRERIQTARSAAKSGGKDMPK